QEISGPVKTIGIGSNYVCALVQDQIRCKGYDRGYYRYDITPPAHLRRPYELLVSGSVPCALDASGLTCWGSSNLKERGWRNPRGLSMPPGGGRACAITDEGVKCAGWAPGVPQGLRNPRKLAVGGYDTCALTDDGIACWSVWNNGATLRNLV